MSKNSRQSGPVLKNQIIIRDPQSRRTQSLEKVLLQQGQQDKEECIVGKERIEGDEGGTKKIIIPTSPDKNVDEKSPGHTDTGQ